MPMGAGGKYDAECEKLQQELGAEGVLLIVFNGSRGMGFSATVTAEVMLAIPAILRRVADDIDSNSGHV